MELGAHLPLIDFGDGGPSPARLRGYSGAAARLGYTFLCANDHLLFSRPWLDGPTALASVIESSGEMTLATTVVLPVVRGPVQTAKTLAAIDVLSGGRLVVGVGPGSSPRDYAAVGVPFEERWQRLDEGIMTLRALFATASPDFAGRFYSTEGIVLEPRPVRSEGPPIWVGSWGSKAGLRRAARLGDGWLASGYNTPPESFRESLTYLSEQLPATGKDPRTFPNGIATMWLYLTDDHRAAARMFTEVLGPMLNRPVDALRRLSLPIGSPEVCAEALGSYAAAGAQRVFLWPLADEIRQLELFQERVAPLLRDAS